MGEPKPDTGSSAPFTSGDAWHSASPFHLPSNAPYAESTLAPSDSASQVAGRLYAAELAAQRSAQANPASASHSSPAPGSRFNLPWGAGSGVWRSDRKEARPPPVPEVPEEEAVQHQDSGIRFRDGDLPLPPALAHGSAMSSNPYGGGEDAELERPPEYEDPRS